MPLKPILRPSAPPHLSSNSQLTTASSRTAATSLTCPNITYTLTQIRHAQLLKRPKRPYTFTQLLTLSDGTAYTIRTTSPLPVYRSTRDTRNAPLWNPSTRELLNVEADEAGRLAAFRSKFGRGWDASKEVTVQARSETEKDKMARMEGGGLKELKAQMTAGEQQQEASEHEGFDVEEEEEEEEEEEDSLLDLISSYGQEEGSVPQAQTDQAKGKKKR